MTTIKETTNIFELPTDPIGNNSISSNITINTNEISNGLLQNQNTNNNQSSSLPIQDNKQMSLDQSTINQIINGLQQATLSGSTQLPSRDIPMDTSNIINDPEIQPNYIPSKNINNEDYINNYENSYNNNYREKKNLTNSLDNIYNEIQNPLLISLLYFIFQLPFFKNFLYNYLKFLFNSDGNYNLNGLLFVSILFGLIIHILVKVTNLFNKF
jgi:hypothetical protein